MKSQKLRPSPQRQRHLLVLAGACLSGMFLAGWWWPLDTEAVDGLRQEVARLQAQTQVPLPVQARKLHGKPPADAPVQQGPSLPDEPGLAEAETVWSWLQQRMQSQGLQLQVLRPQTVTTDKGLPEQAVAMRLQGRWHDWLAMEEALHAHAPWWVIDQWQVVPAAAQSEDVRIELQARLALRPPALAQEGRRVWPVWPVDPGSQRAVPTPLFATAEMAAPASEVAGSLPADPRGWQVNQLRLLGVWRQTGAAHAVVGMGQDQRVIRLGQQIGPEPYRVRRIGDDRVELIAIRTNGPELHLTLQGGRP